jgi:large subunit ribosomal protein L25
MHPFRHEVLHVDFQRVEENRKIHVKVPLHFTHAEDSPASKTTDAIISHVLAELDVSCLPKDLPQFIEVDLSALAVGQSIHVSDLTLPPGVVAVARGPVSPVVATAVIPRVIAEVEEVPAAEEAAPTEEGVVAEEAAPGEKESEKATEKPEKGAEKAPERTEKAGGKEKK